MRVLTSQGLIVPNSGHSGMGYVFKAFLLSPFLRQLAGMYFAVPNGKDLTELKEWLETGKIKPVIDRVFPFHEAKEAYHYMKSQQHVGKVVINIA